MRIILSMLLLMTYLNTCEPVALEEESNTTLIQLNENFQRIRKDPVALREFLWKMPKGGDIHHHLLGSVLAEDYLEAAIKDDLWINPSHYQLYFDQTDALSKEDDEAISINTLLKVNPRLKEEIIDHWSVRNYKEKGRNGRDWFFATFQKFEPALIGNEVQFLTKLCAKAAKENVQYIETIVSVPSIMQKVAGLTSQKQWNPGISLRDHLEEWYEFLKAQNIDQWVEYNAEVMDHWMSQTEKYGTVLRFQNVALRVHPDQRVVFSHLLLAFKTASISRHVVGVNFVAPEDDPIALQHFQEHMAMFHFLHERFPEVSISIHAGELVPKSTLDQENLSAHIDQAINLAGASRVGHGVDILHEERNEELLEQMSRNEIAVEINLESNQVILGTTSTTHPLSTYLDAGVPICLSSDDAAILRSDLTHQYVMAAEYLPNLTYTMLKDIVFNSIRYSFLNLNEKEAVLHRLENAFGKFEAKLVKEL